MGEIAKASATRAISPAQSTAISFVDDHGDQIVLTSDDVRMHICPKADAKEIAYFMELCRAQSSHASLRADAEKAREQQQQMAGEGGEGPAPRGKSTRDPGLLHLLGDARGCLRSGLGSGGLAVGAGCGRWARVEDTATRAAAGLLLPPAQ